MEGYNGLEIKDMGRSAYGQALKRFRKTKRRKNQTSRNCTISYNSNRKSIKDKVTGRIGDFVEKPFLLQSKLQRQKLKDFQPLISSRTGLPRLKFEELVVGECANPYVCEAVSDWAAV